jgi:ferric-dicitrate binding protein FerR (iron transport regulator)
MDELIVKVLKGEATEFEIRQLDRWRALEESHEAEFQSIRSLWNRTEDTRQVDVPPPPPLSSIVSAAEGRRRRSALRRRAGTTLRSPFFGMGLSAAAVGLLFFLGPWGGDDPPLPGTRLTPVESTSTAADVTTLGLSDGSVVRLAAGTHIEFPPSEGDRRVVMEGRAFFAVAPGEDPFVVGTEAGEVTVRGTRFEVLTRDGGLRVVVLEGLVDVQGHGEAVRIGPGQLVHLLPEGAPRVEEAEDLRSLLEWPGGLLIFQETRFSQVAEEIATHFRVSFSVLPHELANRRVTAWFGEESLGEVIQGVCMVVGARCEVEGDEVRVR